MAQVPKEITGSEGRAKEVNLEKKKRTGAKANFDLYYTRLIVKKAMCK